MATKSGRRRDSKHRVLRNGESVRANGKYQSKYTVNGKTHFVYSWRLEPTDPLPAGKKPCLSLRELEKQIGYDLDRQIDIGRKNNALQNYNFVRGILEKKEFGSRAISKVKTSDAKLFLIELQKIDYRGYSSVKTVRGVLRPAFQMTVFVHDDNIYCKYYEVMYTLFHTGMRISEFCGLTIRDIDLKNRTVNIEK